MKHSMLIAMAVCAVMASCGNHAGHEGHDHGSEIAGSAYGGQGVTGKKVADADSNDHGIGDEGIHDEGGDVHEGGDEIILSPEKADAAGVRTEIAEAAPFRDVISVTGKIVSAPGNDRTIVAAIPGIVSFSGPAVEGLRVEAGKPLMIISSDRIQDGDPVRRAKIAYETAASEFERASSLVGDQIISRKDYEAIKSNYETAKIAYEALSKNYGQDGYAVSSPSDGHVKQFLVGEGDYVTVGQPLASVVGDGGLYLRADVPERYYMEMKRVETANFRLPYSSRVFESGPVLSYGRSSETSSYIPVTFNLEGGDELIPGAYAEVWIKTKERRDVISVPVSALTEEQGAYFVYVRMCEESYRKQPVSLGLSDGNRVEIVSGLEGGEQVVTEGAIYVKLASASNAIPAHTHNH